MSLHSLPCSDIHCHVVTFTIKCSERHYLKIVSIMADISSENFLQCWLKESWLCLPNTAELLVSGWHFWAENPKPLKYMLLICNTHWYGNIYWYCKWVSWYITISRKSWYQNRTSVTALSEYIRIIQWPLLLNVLLPDMLYLQNIKQFHHSG